MFCTHCAAEVLSSTANFCYSYEDFRKRKAEERGSKFCEKAKGNAPSSKNTEASEVIIQTGEMIWKDGASDKERKQFTFESTFQRDFWGTKS